MAARHSMSEGTCEGKRGTTFKEMSLCGLVGFYLTNGEIIGCMKIWFRIDRTSRQLPSICVPYSSLGLELAKQYKRGLIEQRGYRETEITISCTDRDGKTFNL